MRKKVIWPMPMGPMLLKVSSDMIRGALSESYNACYSLTEWQVYKQTDAYRNTSAELNFIGLLKWAW